jgi:hypothetical protein
MGERGAGELVFFPPNAWSKRFGPTFVTVRVNGWYSGPTARELELVVERGGEDSDAAWTVRRRYSEFRALHKELATLGPAAPAFPGKAGLRVWLNNDPAFLDARRDALRTWLWTVLASEQALQRDKVRRFLALPIE